jgi:disulfide oxidoreductase YuzD
MFRFRDTNGNQYFATTKVDLVHELYKTSFAKVHSKDIDEWVNQCAKRIWEQYDYRLLYADYDDFVDELIRYGFIKEIN